MADLDRWDMDGSYVGRCEMCGNDMYDDQAFAWIGSEQVHAACKQEMEAELADMDWSQE